MPPTRTSTRSRLAVIQEGVAIAAPLLDGDTVEQRIIVPLALRTCTQHGRAMARQFKSSSLRQTPASATDRRSWTALQFGMSGTFKDTLQGHQITVDRTLHEDQNGC